MSVTGKVKSFNAAKGFGFISHDGEEKDSFAHRSNIITSHPFPTLAVGETVQFDVEEIEGDKRLAKNITGPEGAEPIGVPNGEVKTFNEDKGFGFISVHGQTEDIFVHIANIVHPAGLALTPGTKVTFEVGVDKSGKPSAMNVASIAANPVKGKGKGKDDGWGKGGGDGWGGGGWGKGGDGWGKGGGDGWGKGGGGWGKGQADPQQVVEGLTTMLGMMQQVLGNVKGGGGDGWGKGGGDGWGKGGGDGWGKGGGNGWGKGGGDGWSKGGGDGWGKGGGKGKGWGPY